MREMMQRLETECVMRTAVARDKFRPILRTSRN
jgi:hypothetical protein